MMLLLLILLFTSIDGRIQHLAFWAITHAHAEPIPTLPHTLHLVRLSIILFLLTTTRTLYIRPSVPFFLFVIFHKYPRISHSVAFSRCCDRRAHRALQN